MKEEETLTAPAWGARIASPKPAFCSGCLRGADGETTFIELGIAGRGVVRDASSLAVIADLDRLCLCESCVKQAAECLAFKPQTHREHMLRIAKVVAERDQLQKENGMLRELVAGGLVKTP